MGKDFRVGVWLSNRHRLLADHTNLGWVLEGEPPSHPSLQEGCVLTEGLSAGELPWEKQQAGLQMRDREVLCVPGGFNQGEQRWLQIVMYTSS